MTLRQSQVDEYIQTAKRFLELREIRMPSDYFRMSEKVTSDKHGDIFMMDVRKGRIELKSLNTGLRVNDYYSLIRLDINDREHRNPPTSQFPNGEIIPASHIHIYREGFGDNFAHKPEQYGFTDLSNHTKTIQQFLKFCNIADIKIILQEGLNDPKHF